ncbi:MAG: hypothetical protein MJZ25_08840 [Fibrobacter sp.]|nr:hypothetical protein [Fibrobacter sp.]
MRYNVICVDLLYDCKVVKVTTVATGLDYDGMCDVVASEYAAHSETRTVRTPDNRRWKGKYEFAKKWIRKHESLFGRRWFNYEPVTYAYYDKNLHKISTKVMVEGVKECL